MNTKFIYFNSIVQLFVLFLFYSFIIVIYSFIKQFTTYKQTVTRKGKYRNKMNSYVDPLPVILVVSLKHIASMGQPEPFPVHSDPSQYTIKNKEEHKYLNLTRTSPQRGLG